MKLLCSPQHAERQHVLTRGCHLGSVKLGHFLKGRDFMRALRTQQTVAPKVRSAAASVHIEALDRRLLLSTSSLPLTVGAANKIDEGFFAAGTIVQITASGHGDLVDS